MTTHETATVFPEATAPHGMAQGMPHGMAQGSYVVPPPPPGHGAARAPRSAAAAAALKRTETWLRDKRLWRAESLVVAGAVVVGVFGAILQHANQAAFETRLHEQYRIVNVVVAATRLDAGTLLRREHLTTGQVLSGARTGNMLDENELAKAIGKPLALPLGKGDPVLLTAIAGGAGDGSVAARIPAGKRLFTLDIQDAGTSNAFIRAGDFVDVLTTMDLPGRGSTTFTMLSRVQLTAVGKSLDPQSQAESTQVSFLVTPQEMEVLKQAQVHGAFGLSLRNPNDKEVVKTGKGVALQDLYLRDGIYEKAEIPVEITVGEGKKK